MSFIRIGSPAVVSMAELTAPLYEHIRSSVHFRVTLLAASPSDLWYLYQLTIQTSSHPRKICAVCCVLLLRGHRNSPTYIWSFSWIKRLSLPVPPRSSPWPTASIKPLSRQWLRVRRLGATGGYDPLQASPLLMSPLFFVDFLRQWPLLPRGFDAPHPSRNRVHPENIE